MAAEADLAVAGLTDMIKRIRDDENVLVPNKTLRGLVAALDIVLAAYGSAVPAPASGTTTPLRLVPPPKPRGGR